MDWKYLPTSMVFHPQPPIQEFWLHDHQEVHRLCVGIHLNVIKTIDQHNSESAELGPRGENHAPPTFYQMKFLIGLLNRFSHRFTKSHKVASEFKNYTWIQCPNSRNFTSVLFKPCGGEGGTAAIQISPSPSFQYSVFKVTNLTKYYQICNLESQHKLWKLLQLGHSCRSQPWFDLENSLQNMHFCRNVYHLHTILGSLQQRNVLAWNKLDYWMLI